MSQSSALSRLQSWYAARADGRWEHQYGVRIDTLDNPGWRVSIDLAGTAHENTPFVEVDQTSEDETTWLHCRRVGLKLEGHGGPHQLEAILLLLLNWLEQSP